jgi:heme exporter protein D
MEKAIEIIELRIRSIEPYKNIETFRARIMVLNDVLRDLKAEQKILANKKKNKEVII